jgi:hypothetical protein
MQLNVLCKTVDVSYKKQLHDTDEYVVAVDCSFFVNETWITKRYDAYLRMDKPYFYVQEEERVHLFGYWKVSLPSLYIKGATEKEALSIKVCILRKLTRHLMELEEEIRRQEQTLPISLKKIVWFREIDNSFWFKIYVHGEKKTLFAQLIHHNQCFFLNPIMFGKKGTKKLYRYPTLYFHDHMLELLTQLMKTRSTHRVRFLTSEERGYWKNNFVPGNYDVNSISFIQKKDVS